MKKIKTIFGNIFNHKKANAKVVAKGNQKKNQKANQKKQTLEKTAKGGSTKKGKGAKGKGKNVRRTKSIESVFSVKPRRQTVAEIGSRLTAMNGTPPGAVLFDVSAYVILCVKHNKIALSREESTGFLWLPFIALPSTRTWSDGSVDGVNIILSGGDPNVYLGLKARSVIGDLHCMSVFRLQLPQNQKFNSRLIYCVKLKPNSDAFKCCADTNRMKWLAVQQVIDDKVPKIWGPEVAEYLSHSMKGEWVQRIDEYSLDQAFFYVPRDPPRNLEEELLKSTGYTEKDVERIYGDFVEHCFPAFYMTPTSFTDYMTKYGFERKDKKLVHLFKAFNFKNTGFLSFSELLLGLTSIEPNAINNQSRIKLVFKYFDVDRDGCLNREEFTQMVREIYPKDNDSLIQKRVEESMKRIGLRDKVVAFDDFFKACGNHQFRGTSTLCRSNRSVITQISRSMASRTLSKAPKASESSLASILKTKRYKGVCKSCKDKKYEFALHSVRLNADGRCVDPKQLVGADQIKRKSSEKSLSSNESSTESSESVKRLSSTNVLNMSREKFSNDFTWNPKSVANYLMEQIRAFNVRKGSHSDNKGVMDAIAERQKFVTCLEELCSIMEKIVAQEERCVQMSSPAYVIGDIHGNLEDLLTMERVLWKSIPIVPTNLLFLGDYVDRGKWSVECAAYIMCLKVLAPNKVVMLRGNHEVRDLQLHYSYKKECLRKYGDNYGQKVFDITNRVFDKLPVCAVIDEAIYCAHGGIPCSTRLIQQINQVKADLKDPERESAIAWEILWSDPIGAQQFAETAQLLQVRVESARGFLTNNKRGTAFLFGEEAVNNFLQNNGLTHIVRAHEVPAHGYAFLFGNKCTTIFSSSHYCGNNNEAACVFIDNEKLRIIRLDTKNNAPASD